MAEVRRYWFDARAGTLTRYEDGATMYLSADGELVPASDYDALAAENRRLTRALAAMTADYQKWHSAYMELKYPDGPVPFPGSPPHG